MPSGYGMLPVHEEQTARHSQDDDAAAKDYEIDYLEHGYSDQSSWDEVILAVVSRRVASTASRPIRRAISIFDGLTTTIKGRTSPTSSRPLSRVKALVRLLVAASVDLLTPTITIRSLSKQPPKLRPTAYLDGLRGICAVIVAFFHFNCDFWPNLLMRGYGSPALGDSPPNHYIFQLPILRLVVAGRFSVLIFFCISGYVLSSTGLHLSHTRQYTALLKTLQSSFFRRWTRLMLPCLASTFIMLLLAQFRLIQTNPPPHWQEPFLSAPTSQPAPILRPRAGFSGVPPLPTFYEQASHWFHDSLIMVDPWRFGRYYRVPYNPALWSIQIELLGSFVVYGLVIALSQTRPKLKLCILALIALHMSSTPRYIYVPFIAGMFLAQLDVMRNHNSSSHRVRESGDQKSKIISTATPISTTTYITSALSTIWPYILLPITLYTGSHPDNPSETPGYRTLSHLIPPWWPANDRDYFHPTLSAILLLASLTHCPSLRRPFETRFAQYLGEMSFSLYVLHLVIIESVATRLVPACVRLVGRLALGRGDLSSNNESGEAIVGKMEGFASGLGVVLGCSILVLFWFWVSDIFTRIVDRGAVRISKKMDEWVRIDDNDDVGEK